MSMLARRSITRAVVTQRNYSWGKFTAYPDPRVYFSGQGFYKELENKPDPSAPFPWNSISVKPSTNMEKDYKNHTYGRQQHTINVVTYNPKGRAVRPPEPIFFLHGAGQNHAVWENLARELNYPYGVLAYDLYGHGLSHAVEQTDIKDTTRGGIIRHVLDFVRVLNYFGYDRAFIVGQDIGGAVGTLCAKMFPDRIQGTAFIDSGFSDVNIAEVAEKIKQQMSQSAPTEYTSDQYKSLLEQNTAKSATQAADAVNDFLNCMENEINEDIEYEYVKVRNPCAVVRPGKDALLSDQGFKLIQTYLNTKMAVTVKDATSSHDLLTNPEHVKVVKTVVEDLVSRFDEHRKIELFFEQLLASRDKERDQVEQK